MHRRTSLALIGAALALATGRSATAAPGYRVSLQQLQEMLAQRFPARYPVAGLFELSLEAPQLYALPDLNRLGSALQLRAAGPALRRSHRGEVALDFGLRYEPSDRTVRAHHLRVETMRVEGLAGEAQALIERSVGELARQSMLEVVLHRLRPQDLALADTMGVQPGPITVTSAGLEIAFVNKNGP